MCGLAGRCAVAASDFRMPLLAVKGGQATASYAASPADPGSSTNTACPTFGWEVLRYLGDSVPQYRGRLSVLYGTVPQKAQDGTRRPPACPR